MSKQLRNHVVIILVALHLVALRGDALAASVLLLLQLHTRCCCRRRSNVGMCADLLASVGGRFAAAAAFALAVCVRSVDSVVVLFGFDIIVDHHRQLERRRDPSASLLLLLLQVLRWRRFGRRFGLHLSLLPLAIGSRLHAAPVTPPTLVSLAAIVCARILYIVDKLKARPRLLRGRGGHRS